MPKYCSRCQQTLDHDAFGRNRARYDGLTSYCRACERKRVQPSRATPEFREYHRAYYQKHAEEQRARARQDYYDHREERLARSREYQAAHREDMQRQGRARNQRLKLAAFAAYGGPTCVCCRETNLGFLTIDHIDGCTREQRKAEGLGSRLYLWLKKHGYPPGYQVLCYNCNLGRARHGGVCPHTLSAAAN